MCLPREQTGANYKQLNVVSRRGLCHTVSLGLGLGLNDCCVGEEDLGEERR